jgi:hypothetical protein
MVGQIKLFDKKTKFQPFLKYPPYLTYAVSGLKKAKIKKVHYSSQTKDKQNYL